MHTYTCACGCVRERARARTCIIYNLNDSPEFLDCKSGHMYLGFAVKPEEHGAIPNTRKSSQQGLPVFVLLDQWP
jgi:hypothetical protein